MLYPAELRDHEWFDSKCTGGTKASMRGIELGGRPTHQIAQPGRAASEGVATVPITLVHNRLDWSSLWLRHFGHRLDLVSFR